MRLFWCTGLGFDYEIDYQLFLEGPISEQRGLKA